MKVRCNNNVMYEDILTVGEIYDAEDYSYNRFKMTGNQNAALIVSKSRFSRIDETPVDILPTSMTFTQSKASSVITQLKGVLGNNSDGHLSVHECIVIRDAIDSLTEYHMLYPNAVSRAIKAKEDAECNANLFYDLEKKLA